MALLLDNTVLYHPGRTGGHWVKAVVRQAGLIRGESTGLHDTPEDLRYWHEAASRPSSIAFIRHPLTWIRSLWVHETQFGWTNDALRPPDEFSTFSAYLKYLIEAFPGGAVKAYFAPFIENVTLIGKFENLGADLPRLLQEAGENVAGVVPVRRVINGSADDIVSAAAKAPRALLERFLANEAGYCARFGYAGIPGNCVAADEGFHGEWAPVLTTRKESVPVDGRIDPDHLFLFSDGTVWRGRAESRRWQLAVWDALSRNHRPERGSFLEFGCSDGLFVFLAEQLGHAPCWGVDSYHRSTTAAAVERLDSKANFVDPQKSAGLDDHSLDTILIRDALNHTPWPHQLLLQARQKLAEGGEIIIGSVIVDADPDPGLCVSNFGESALFPQSCPMIMSRKYLLNLISQCGLAVAEVCSEYDEIAGNQKQQILGDVSKVFNCPPEGLLRRVVWRLRAEAERAGPAEVRWWLQLEPAALKDCSPIDLDRAACVTIDQLTAENQRLRQEVQRLELGLRDREADLERERCDAAIRNEELIDRTNRLEQALAELESLSVDAMQT